LKEKIMRSAEDGTPERIHLPNYDAAGTILTDEEGDKMTLSDADLPRDSFAYDLGEA
jgi:hypothetical protein